MGGPLERLTKREPDRGSMARRVVEADRSRPLALPAVATQPQSSLPRNELCRRAHEDGERWTAFSRNADPPGLSMINEVSLSTYHPHLAQHA